MYYGLYMYYSFEYENTKIAYASTTISGKAIDDTKYLSTGITIPDGKSEVQVEEMERKVGGFYIFSNAENVMRQ